MTRNSHFFLFIILSGVWFPKLAFAFFDCEKFLISQGSPENPFCVVMDDNANSFRKCIKELKARFPGDDYWYLRCGGGELDFYKKDKEAYFSLIDIRNDVRGTESQHRFMISSVEYDAFKLNPSAYVGCVKVKSRVDKSFFSSECSKRDVETFVQEPELFTRCIDGYGYSNRRWTLKDDEYNCASPEIIRLFKDSPDVYQVCFDLLKEDRYLNLGNCLGLNQEISKAFPQTYSKCMLKWGKSKNKSFCEDISKYNSKIEQCFSLYKDSPRKYVGFCAKFEGKAWDSENIDFFIENSSSVKSCIQKVQDSLISGGEPICQNPKNIKVIKEYPEEFTQCLKLKNPRFYVNSICTDVSILNAFRIADTLEARTEIISCHISLRGPSGEEDDRNHYSNPCVQPFLVKCAGPSKDYWKEFLTPWKELDINKWDMHYFLTALNENSDQCPNLENLTPWIQCMLSSFETDLSTVSRRGSSFSKFPVEVGRSCLHCVEGIQELNQLDSDKYPLNEGISWCSFLSSYPYFKSLTKDQICYAMANTKGYKKGLVPGWRGFEQMSDLWDVISTGFGKEKRDGPTCPQYIYPPHIGSEAEVKKHEDSVPDALGVPEEIETRGE